MNNDLTPPTFGLTADHGEALRRIALRSFVVLIGVNALIAIGAILGVGDGDDFEQWQVLTTSSLITAASLIVAANAAAIQRGRLGAAPLITIAAAIVGAAGLIWAVWDHNDVGDTFWKTVGISSTIGVAGTYLSLISLPRLRSPWSAAQIVGGVTATLMGTGVVLAILFEDGGSVEPYAVGSVILAAATLLTTVGARLAPASPANGNSTIPAEAPPPLPAGTGTTVVRHCPICGADVAPQPTSNEHACTSCGTHFQVVVGPSHAFEERPLPLV